MAHYQSQLESVRAMKEKSALKDLEGQIQSLRVELNLERQRRERLETRYTKRDDQVSQLRSTFDQSLNTISKDTKNIKTIIGKSLQKIDRIQENEVTDSDFVDTDSESFPANAKLNTNSKYLSLPSSRSKALEFSIEGLTEKLKNGSVSSTPKSHKHSSDKKYHATSAAPKSAVGLSGKSLSLVQETPVRDEVPSYRKSSKRITR